MVRFYYKSRRMEQTSGYASPPDENQPTPTSTSEVPETAEGKPPEESESTREAIPSQPSAEDEGAAGPSSADRMDEVFRVNKLLQIKNMDWTRQLEQVVCGFYFYVYSRDSPFPCFSYS